MAAALVLEDPECKKPEHSILNLSLLDYPGDVSCCTGFKRAAGPFASGMAADGVSNWRQVKRRRIWVDLCVNWAGRTMILPCLHDGGTPSGLAFSPRLFSIAVELGLLYDNPEGEGKKTALQILGGDLCEIDVMRGPQGMHSGVLFECQYILVGMGLMNAEPRLRHPPHDLFQAPPSLTVHRRLVLEPGRVEHSIKALLDLEDTMQLALAASPCGQNEKKAEVQEKAGVQKKAEEEVQKKAEKKATRERKAEKEKKKKAKEEASKEGRKRKAENEAQEKQKESKVGKDARTQKQKNKKRKKKGKSRSSS